MEPDHQNLAVTSRKSSVLTILFWAIVILYSGLIALILIPYGIRRGSEIFEFLFFALMALLFILGLAELFLASRSRIRSPLRLFLILTGLAAVGTPLSILMHNFVSMLLGTWFGAGEEGFFFIIALIVCPLAFLAGLVGTIVCLTAGKSPGRLTTI